MELFKLFGTIAIKNEDANDAIDNTTGKVSAFGSKLKSGIGTVAKFGTAVAAAAGTAAVAVGSMAVKASTAYETNFAKVSTLLSGSEADIEKYKKALLDASSETGIAAEEMSEAVYSAISASVDQENAIEFAKKASELARGGFTSTATAVDVLTTAINAYGMEVDDAGKISDMLINTQNLGKTTVDELASSMGKIIPTANSFGVQLDVLCGSYAEITKNGIATAEATTYMNSMLNELGKSGTKASKALESETGKSFKECMESGMSLVEVLGILQESAEKSGLSMGDMFGSAEAGKAAVVLQTNAEDLTTMISSMGNAANATSEAASKMGQTVEMRFSKIKNTFQNVIVQLGESLLPIVEQLLSSVETVLPKVTEIILSIAPVLEQVASFVLPTLLEMISKLLPFASNLIEQILPILVSILSSIMPEIMNLAEFLIPIILDVIQQLLPIISEIAQAILPILVNLISQVLPILTNLIQSVLPILLNTIQLLLPFALQIIDLILPVVVELLQIIEPLLVMMIETLLPIMTDALLQILPPLLEIASVALPILMDAIRELVPLAEWLIDLWSKLLQNWLDHIISIVNRVKNVFLGIVEFFKKIFSGDIKGAFLELKKIIGEILGGIVETIKLPINHIITLINGFLSGLNNIQIPDWVPVVGGKGINISQIPMLYNGGEVTGSGRVLVGEKGPEFLDLPRGARVVPLDKSMASGNESYLLEQILEVLNQILASNVRIDLNKREFGRLVRDYA